MPETRRRHQYVAALPIRSYFDNQLASYAVLTHEEHELCFSLKQKMCRMDQNLVRGINRDLIG